MKIRGPAVEDPTFLLFFHPEGKEWLKNVFREKDVVAPHEFDEMLAYLWDESSKLCKREEGEMNPYVPELAGMRAAKGEALASLNLSGDHFDWPIFKRAYRIIDAWVAAGRLNHEIASVANLGDK